MGILMARVDERLIHGQVALSWLKTYDADIVIVIDNESANDEMKTMLLEMAVSGRLQCIVCTEEDAVQVITEHQNSSLFLCTKKPQIFSYLLDNGISIKDVNIGGIYNAEGRKQLYKTIFIDDELKNAIIRIGEFPNVKVEYRMLPQDNPVDIIADLKKHS